MTIQAISTAPPSSREASAVPREVRAAAPPAQEEAQAAQSAQPTQSVQSVNPVQLKAAVNSVREYIKPINSNLEFSVNDETDQIVVKVVDRETREVIRQIPSKEMIAIAEALDSIKGLLVKQKA